MFLTFVCTHCTNHDEEDAGDVELWEHFHVTHGEEADAAREPTVENAHTIEMQDECSAYNVTKREIRKDTGKKQRSDDLNFLIETKSLTLLSVQRSRDCESLQRWAPHWLRIDASRICPATPVGTTVA